MREFIMCSDLALTRIVGISVILSLSLRLWADHRGRGYEVFGSVMLSTTNVIATDKTGSKKKKPKQKERLEKRLCISKEP